MKYIKYSFLAALGFLFAQCTEEGDLSATTRSPVERG